MKNMLKKNQIMITALAIMIAVAGYLNFAGTKVTDEEIMTVDSDTVINDNESIVLSDDLGSEENMPVLTDISDEDILQPSAYGDIESLDTDISDITADYLDEGMAENVEETTPSDSEVPGEAVFTSTSGMNSLSSAKLLKEQTRAKNKETLMEIINNANITETQKQEAIDNMISITDIAEKETAAEILLESKGFSDVVVSINDTGVDVVVNAVELSEAQRAQIEDIITRKTGVSPETIIISTMAAE
ncbi:MAG TPA: stage III sporulation protein AH [Lachnospiraceae bacterium]|nr:stage III sporulation protein AH [Lachnospiraceae bacterium]